MNLNDGIKRFDMAGSDPDASTLAELESVFWWASPEVGTGFEAAVIPHWFDCHILRHLMQVDEKTANEVLRELCHLPMVELFVVRDGWHVTELARLAFRVHMVVEEPDRFRGLSERAAECFQ